MSDSPACEIEIVIPWDDADLLEALRSIQVREAAGWNFTGAVEGTTVLLTLTPVILGSLVSILKIRAERAKAVKIRVKGFVIEGADPEKIESILSQILRQPQSKSDNR
jgi:hypothetical protein